MRKPSFTLKSTPDTRDGLSDLEEQLAMFGGQPDAMPIVKRDQFLAMGRDRVRAGPTSASKASEASRMMVSSRASLKKASLKRKHMPQTSASS